MNEIVAPACRGSKDRIAAHALLPAVTLFLMLAPPGACASSLGGSQAPALSPRDLDGVEYRFDALHDRAVIVHFFATWCAPCGEEPASPSLPRRSRRLSDSRR
ncbi:hypothetical protein MWN34_09710 [Ancylobacter sp. 6x-1]|uniref:Redoxin domain-containing protein n=1 Tax=Ancylobacter crimeensis TaxID=2579147 RepID=A0ABT0DB54_9HYPH|nr:hypothetical protein [Ancylobacter crimeensis]MCK0197188.1 hypothetical protein [Ancylobacter crimeensis]